MRSRFLQKSSILSSLMKRAGSRSAGLCPDSHAHCFVLLKAIRGRKKQMFASSQQFIPVQWRLSGSHVSILELRSPKNGTRSHSVNERTAGTPPHGAARPMVVCSLTPFKTAVCSWNVHTAQDHPGSQGKSNSSPVFIAALRVPSPIDRFFPSKHATRNLFSTGQQAFPSYRDDADGAPASLASNVRRLSNR